MQEHHRQSINNIVDYFRDDNSVEALLLGGSIAHGFEKESSDIDIMILVTDLYHNELSRQNKLTFLNTELCTYPGGYVDGKFIPLNFLREVAEKGSEPARFAFQGARILFSRNKSYDDIVKSIVQYPQNGKAERLRRFSAQLEAWYWYVNESVKHNNQYLLWLSISKLILFGGRLILTHNELLYPFHKWFLKVLESAADKPPDMMESIGRLYKDASTDNARQFYEMIRDFRDWGLAKGEWTTYFVQDCEWNWRDGKPPVDDL
ncbi:MAG: nucleotidyltransferase domain-containing protein [Candidatus Neomarinimicrobiota bacterium]